VNWIVLAKQFWVPIFTRVSQGKKVSKLCAWLLKLSPLFNSIRIPCHSHSSFLCSNDWLSAIFFMPKILLVTGEASGDMHGAKLGLALRELHPGIELVGVGGQMMLEAGISLLPDVDRVDVMGVPGIQQVWKGWKTLRTLSAYVRRERLDAIILIDSPGLNLRLAKAVAKTSQTIIYYIAPQVWAWGSRMLLNKGDNLSSHAQSFDTFFP